MTSSTKGRQRPWHNASLGREVFLGGETRVATLTKVSPSSLTDVQHTSTLVLVPAPTKTKITNPQAREAVEPSNTSMSSKWAIEQSFWDEISKRNSIAHYQAYLRQYPNGQFTIIADINIQNLRQKQINGANRDSSTGTQIAAISQPGPSTTNNPPDRKVSILPETLLSIIGTTSTEAYINFNRNQRTDLQLRLTALGHDTQGADGKIGPNSRRAIADWQQHRSIPATTYSLTPLK